MRSLPVRGFTGSTGGESSIGDAVVMAVAADAAGKKGPTGGIATA